MVTDYNKALDVIDSCETEEQLSSARNYIDLFKKKWPKSDTSVVCLEMEFRTVAKRLGIELNSI